MEKKVLIIINPRSGTMRANKYLTGVAEMFVRAGYMPTVLPTTKHGDGTAYAKDFAKEFDLIVGIGGDGTFNEVVAGVLDSGESIPIGYIPAGSTNDFASSLGISKDVLQNAKNIVEGKRAAFDIGSFNGRKFSYVASFGAFTEASYSTPQSIKNMLGHLAYVLEGVKEGIMAIASLNPIHMKIEADGMDYEGDYIFGAISNSTSIAGILTLKKEYVNMNDGMFEMLLIKMPRNPLELAEILHALLLQNFESSMLVFVSAKTFHIQAPADVSWTLDGEYQEGCTEILVENLHSAIELMLPGEEERLVLLPDKM
ncbi:MAG: YegS/Rv2252/BmrU family lipid kinase [Firmicutes bacterium]|nr:YegS/Rv2252/BmrU family lipid kinase [Bacillota bacterium]